MDKQNYKYKIAVIIVNYNVEFFLEQCLNSVKKALKNVSGEVFIVDNNSIDNSVSMVETKFPEYQLIDNKKNVGFSTANNQAIKLSQSEYVLLLNPDTVIEEDTLEKVINFMDKDSKAGGLGVRMIDGKGRFLPESKRGLPTPQVAFYKIFGLSNLFPKSKKFGQYHLGHLDEFETNEVDILSGAFMLLRKETLNRVGLLDETFFMYGEDIDLSYRIIKEGYKNFYFPKTQIIHYKGESTKKSSVNYVFVFYNAMIIFAKKHFSNKNAKLFSQLINLAIYFRAFLAILVRFVKKMTLPTIDFSLLILSLFGISFLWKNNNIPFPAEIIKVALPSYVLTWLVSNLFNGSYDNPVKLKNILKGTFIGSVIILTGYALLPKTWQFSRLFILLATGNVFLYFVISRWLINFFNPKIGFESQSFKKFAIIGDETEVLRVKEILNQTTISNPEVIFVASKTQKSIELFKGNISQLDQIAHIYQIDELIFCAKNTSANEVIFWMNKLKNKKLDFKIAQPDSVYLIGSNSIDTAGDMYVLNINNITSKENIRNKRTFDFLVSITLIAFSPILLLAFKNKKSFIINIFKVLFGKYSIVGYNENQSLNLPKIKSGILSNINNLNDSNSEKFNLIYARDYSVWKDLNILLKNFTKMDRI